MNGTLMHRRRATGLLLAAAASFMARGSSAHSADAALVAAAKKEGTVTWYTSFIANQIARPLADAFQRKYPGVRVELVTGVSSDLYQKAVAEARAGQMKADAMSGYSIIWRLIEQGLADKYTPASAAGYPAEFVDPAGFWVNQVAYYLDAAVNTELVKAADYPRTHEDLLDPKWKNKLVWAGGATGGAPLHVAQMIHEMGEVKGMDYMRRLAAQNVVNLPSNQRVVLDSVISGEYPIALGVYNHHIDISRAKGAPIAALNLQPLRAIGDVIVAMKNAPHPNAARLLIDYIVSDEGQQLFAKAGYLPASPRVPALNPDLTPAGGKFRAVFIPPRELAEKMDSWTKIYTELFVK